MEVEMATSLNLNFPEFWIFLNIGDPWHGPSLTQDKGKMFTGYLPKLDFKNLSEAKVIMETSMKSTIWNDTIRGSYKDLESEHFQNTSAQVANSLRSNLILPSQNSKFQNSPKVEQKYVKKIREF